MRPKSTSLKARFAQMAALLVLSFAALLSTPPARAAAMSNYLETALINHIFRGTPYTAPGTLYFALYTSACSDAGGGTEVTGGNYTRQAVAANTSNWAATSGGNGSTSNINTVTWGTVTWSGTVTHYGIVDASTSGNLLFCIPMTASQIVTSGNTVSFAPGAAVIWIDD